MMLIRFKSSIEQSTLLRQILSSSLLVGLFCVICVTVILYWRRPDAFYNPQLWAEDGNIFFSDAFLHGANSLTIPYSSYFHLLARLTALLGNGIPLRSVPHWYLFASWLFLVSLIAYIFSPRFSFPLGTKLLLGLALVINTADNEVFFNLANWATLSSFFWLLLVISNEPESKPQIGFDFLLLIASGLSSPFVVCLWPLFLGRWGIRHTRHSLILFGLALVIVIIQLWHMPSRAIHEGNSLPSLISIVTTIDVLIFHFGAIFLGEETFNLTLTTPLRIYGLIVMGGFYGGLLWQATKQKNWPLGAVTLGGLLAWLLSLYVLRHNEANFLIHWLSRHFFIPAVTSMWALILLNIKYNKSWLPLAMSFIAFFFLTPSHKNQVFVDLDWGEHVAHCISPPQLKCLIPLNPVWNPPVWFVTIDSHLFTVPPISNTLAIQFNKQIELLGYETSQDKANLSLKLIWRASSEMKSDYKFFIRLFDPNKPNTILTQAERMPLGGRYPTSNWIATEIIIDQIIVPSNALLPGQYTIGIGWYNPQIPELTQMPISNQGSSGQIRNNMVILPLKIMAP